MLKVVKTDGRAEYVLIETMKDRSDQKGVEIEATAKKIMNDVKLRGYEAVEEYSMTFDHALPHEIDKAQLKATYDSLDKGLVAALEKAAANIKAYNERLMKGSSEWVDANGAVVGQLVRGFDCVGIYVPGGTAAYPSSVLMIAVPARVAGVREIVMATPPTENLNQAVLAAAYIAGVDRVIGVGGVQAVAALTYGAGFIPRVDKLAGPGNAYVTAAKRLAFGDLDIDIVAGPSEILIIADDTANPVYVAADMLGQAEHDELASSILLTTSERLAGEVQEEIKKQIKDLPRRDIIERSLNDFGAIIICDSLEDACRVSNEIAPEHLEIQTENPRREMALIKNAGAIFLGQYSAEAIGDYIAGPSHVLPTAGTARFFSPLSCESFLKRMSVIEYTGEALDAMGEYAALIADSEKLDAHANSIRVRLKK